MCSGQGSIFLFFAGRIEEIKGNLDAVSDYIMHKEFEYSCYFYFLKYI